MRFPGTRAAGGPGAVSEKMKARGRRMKQGLQGYLFKYDIDDALYYCLDLDEAFNFKKVSLNIRKRSL